MDPISGIILAGGRSTRMGRDKASLPFRDGTLLSVQRDKLRALGITDILLSGYGDGMIADDIPDCGPLGGLAACLQRAEHPRALVLSVDVPLVPVETLQALIAAHTRAATLLKHGDRIEPLIAVYDTALGEKAQALLRSGRRAVRALLEEADWRTVSVADDSLLYLNCNTPEAYEAALRRAE